MSWMKTQKRINNIEIANDRAEWVCVVRVYAIENYSNAFECFQLIWWFRNGINWPKLKRSFWSRHVFEGNCGLTSDQIVCDRLAVGHSRKKIKRNWLKDPPGWKWAGLSQIKQINGSYWVECLIFMKCMRYIFIRLWDHWRVSSTSIS